MKTKILIIAFFLSQVALSQTIKKSSIDNGGASVSNTNIQMVYTIGEVNIQEVTVGNIGLSEGFIGPRLTTSKTYVPDDNFEQELITLGYDDVPDDYVLTSNISSLSSLFISSKDIADLTGIEDFTSLTSLDCQFNQLTELELSQNTALKSLMCAGNQLSTLDLTHNTALTYVFCSNNQITDLNISQCTGLNNLYCSNNNLSILDVSAHTLLLRLDCGLNQISILDVSYNTALIDLKCHSNLLTQLDVTFNSALTKLICENNQLSELVVSNNAALQFLNCGKNQLISLDVSFNLSLNEIECYYNQLVSLDVSQNPSLTKLLCQVNDLTQLGVRNGNNAIITSFNALNNELSCINVDDETADHSSWDVDQGVILSNDCGYNTQRGELVQVFPISPITKKVVDVTFQRVELSGNTSLDITNTGPVIPDGFASDDPLSYFNIETTAEYEGLIEIALDYSEITFANEAALRLLHYENDKWEDVTTFLDIENDIIYGVVNSLSPFVIVQDIQPPVFAEVNDITVTNDPAAAGAIVNFTIPVASDNSSEVSTEQTDGTGLTSGSFFPIGITTLSYQAIDEAGNTANCSFNVVVENPAPVIDEIIAPVDPIVLGENAIVEVFFTDNNLTEATINWGDGSEVEAGDISSQPIIWEHSYSATGVYPVCINLLDAGGEFVEEIYRYIVIYHSEGGSVTGGGWIYSPPGAYLPNPIIEGTANFGFVSQYKKGSTIPEGNTEFQFLAGSINFKSTAYEWLVITGSKVMYKGSGTINGFGSYGFILSAIDAALSPSTIVDKFRIKIWDKNNNNILVYDNNLEVDENANPTTEISGGSIVIHKSKIKVAQIEPILTLKPENSNIMVYPNPFNDRLHFEFTYPKDVNALIEIYDFTGRKIETVFDRKIKGGAQNNVDFISKKEVPATYFYRIKLGEEIYYNKVICVKR